MERPFLQNETGVPQHSVPQKGASGSLGEALGNLLPKASPRLPKVSLRPPKVSPRLPKTPFGVLNVGVQLFCSATLCSYGDHFKEEEATLVKLQGPHKNKEHQRKAKGQPRETREDRGRGGCNSSLAAPPPLAWSL